MARTSARYERLAERFPMMVKELRRKGVTLQLLWEEYLRAHPDGYQNSQFCYHFHFWRKSAEVSMHIDHKAGEKLFVDYAGDRLAIVDPDSGKEQPVETFVAILAASELTYVEASATQQSDDWTRSNERALRYCGGSTQVIVPDNLRSAVSRSDPYEPGINATFDAFAQHYGVVIMPARVRQARDKALVESAVRLTYQRIYAPLRDRAFHSLDELNAAIRPLLEQHNRRRLQRLPSTATACCTGNHFASSWTTWAAPSRSYDLIGPVEAEIEARLPEHPRHALESCFTLVGQGHRRRPAGDRRRR